MEIIKKLEQDVDRLTDLMQYYKSMSEQATGKGLFVYVVNEVCAMKLKDGIAEMGSYSEASVLTGKVADEIHAKGSFKNSKGEKVTPIGVRPAETFFAEQADDVLETIGIIEKSLEAIKQKQS